MFDFSGWIISVSGVCLASIIIDLILPSGKTNGVIKRVLSYVIILVLLMPISKLFSADFSLNELFYNSEYVLQDNYICNINQSKLSEMENSICEDFEKVGIVGANVSISADIFDVDMKINAIYVDLCNVVISGNFENIDIKTEVVRVVQKYVIVGEDKVIIYE